MAPITGGSWVTPEVHSQPANTTPIHTNRAGGRFLSGGRAERALKQHGGERDAAGPVSAPFALQPVLAHGMELGRRRQRRGTGRARGLHNCCRDARRRRRGCEEPQGRRPRDLEVSAPRWVRNRGAGGAGNAQPAGTCRARSWHLGHSGSVICQVEKGKAVELKEQLSERFDALRREHEETLRGARQPLGRATLPQPPQLLGGRGTHTGGPPPAPRHHRARAGLAVRVLVPVTLGTCPPAELRRAHEQEKLLLAETHHRSQEALQVPREESPRF